MQVMKSAGVKVVGDGVVAKALEIIRNELTWFKEVEDELLFASVNKLPTGELYSVDVYTKSGYIFTVKFRNRITKKPYTPPVLAIDHVSSFARTEIVEPLSVKVE